MNPKDIRDAKVSETVRRLNPHLFGVDALRSKVHEPENKQALVGESQRRKTRATGLEPNRPFVRVSLVYFGSRLLDDDNLVGSFKHFRDAIARSIGIDDGIIKWDYSQHITAGQPGTAVKIDITPTQT